MPASYKELLMKASPAASLPGGKESRPGEKRICHTRPFPDTLGLHLGNGG